MIGCCTGNCICFYAWQTLRLAFGLSIVSSRCPSNGKYVRNKEFTPEARSRLF